MGWVLQEGDYERKACVQNVTVGGLGLHLQREGMELA